MKAPDSIYIQTNAGEAFSSKWTTIPFRDFENTEYIRKEALMEWAKFVLKCQEEELDKYDGPSYMKASTMGRIDAYKVLIAKLNSM